jgi:5-methyltetrahydrofolate--homocysteine methyltransferase
VWGEQIDRDQLAAYAHLNAMTVAEAERWLGPRLNYDPALSVFNL